MAEEKKSKKKLSDEIYNRWMNYNNSYFQKWRRVHQECFDFYLGDQLTAAQKEDLKNSGMPDFVINMLLPAVQTMKYFLTANNPRWQAVGFEGSDAKKAAVFATIGDYIWYNSNGKLVLSNVVLDVIVKSKGFFHVYVDPNADGGLGEVMVTWEDPFNVYVPPNCKDPFLRDADSIIIHKLKTKSELMNELPQFKDLIEKVSGLANTSEAFSERDYEDSPTILGEDITFSVDKEGRTDTLFDFFEVYEKTPVPYVNVMISVPPSEGELLEVKKQVEVRVLELQAEYSVQLKELEESLKKQVQEGSMLPERMALELAKAKKEIEIKIEEERQYYLSQLRKEATKVEQKNITKEEYDELVKDKEIAQFIVSAYDYYETRIRKIIVFGDKVLYDALLPEPINEYPIFQLPAIYTGTPYPISFLAPAIGKQKEINKAHQIMIHNANLGSSLRWLIPEGTVDLDFWENYSSAPGSLLTYRDRGTGQAPREILPAPLNNAFYTIVEKGKQEIEYLIGIFGIMMGNTDNSPETYRGMLAIDEYGTRRLRAWINEIFEPGLSHLGKLIHKFARATYKINKVFRIVQPNPETGAIETVQQEINIPIYDDFGEIVGRWNDLQSYKYDVVYVSGSTMPLNRWALLDEYFKWFQAGLIDDIEFIKHTDIRDKEGVIRRNSTYAKLMAQLQQLQEAVKNRDGDIETLSRQVLQLSLKAREYGMLHQMKSKVLKTQLEAERTVDKLKAEAQAAKSKKE